MAKLGKALQTKARGRVGSIVYSIVKGEQVARALPEQVANPRSDAQMEQRTRLANIVALFRVNKPWMVKFGFESKQSNWSDYNAFTSANLYKMGVSEVYLTKWEASQGAAIAAPVQVTKGTLRSIQHVFNASANEVRTNLSVGNLSGNISDITVGALTAALIGNNNGIKEGDFLSFIRNIQQTDTVTGVPYVVERQHQITLSSEDTTTLAEAFGVNGIFIITGPGENFIGYQFGADTEAVTFVMSRVESGTTKVSTQSMVLNNTTTFEAYGSSAQRARAYASYGSTDANFLSGQRTNSETVSLTQSILTVDGVAAGQYYGTLQSKATEGVKHTVKMSAPVSSDSVVSASIYTTAAPTTANAIAAANITISGTSLVLDTTNLGSSNTNVLNSITITIDGSDYSASFSTSQGSDDNSEGQTE